MLAIIPPLTEVQQNSASISQFMASGAVATVILITALILKELLDDGSQDSHKKHIISALNIAINPLTFIFAIIVLYKIFEVLRF